MRFLQEGGRNIITAMMLCVVAIVANGQDDQKQPSFVGSVRGDATVQGHVVLLWNVKEWQAQQVGFEVRRGDVGADGVEYVQRIGPYPIQPNLDLVHLQAEGLPEAFSFREQMIHGKLPTDAKGIIRLFESSEKDFRVLAGVCYDSIDLARAFGFGLVDKSSEFGKTYRYTVARVINDAGRVRSEEPFATITVTARRGDFRGPEILDLNVKRVGSVGNLAELTWRIDKKEADAHAAQIRSLAVLKGPPAAPLEEEDPQRVPLISRSLSEDGRYYRYRFSEGKIGEDQRAYALVPVNHMGTRGIIMTQPVVLPRKRERLEKIARVHCQVVDNGVLVKWDHKMPDGEISGYEIRRYIRGADGFEVANDELVPWGRRIWADRDVLNRHPGAKILYVVVAVTGDYRSNQMQQGNEVVIPWPEPPAVEGFTADVVIEKDKRFIVCQWKPVETGGLAGYRIQRRIEDTKRWQDWGLTDAETTQYRGEMSRGVSRVVLRVVAVNEQGATGDGGEMVMVRAAPLDVPDYRSAMVTHREVDGGIEFRWMAAPFHYCAGFRLTVDGKLLVDEKELGPYVRQYKTWAVGTNAKEYVLVAVDEWGRESVIAKRAFGKNEPSKFVGHREIAKGCKVVDDVPFRRGEEAIYAKREYLQWDDGHKKLHGTSTFYRRDGSVRRTTEYQIGTEHGISRVFDADGKLLLVAFYINGQLTSKAVYLDREGDAKLTEADRKWLEEHRKNK